MIKDNDVFEPKEKVPLNIANDGYKKTGVTFLTQAVSTSIEPDLIEIHGKK